MVFPRVGPGWHLRSWKAVPVCQTRHQTHSRHGGTQEDYSLTGAQKSNSPGPWVRRQADESDIARNQRTDDRAGIGRSCHIAESDSRMQARQG